MSLYEIEIKSLLGSKENADNLKAKVEARGGSLASENKQLNHYFLLTDRARLKEAFEKFIPDSKKTFFRQILDEGKDCSVRTRRSEEHTSELQSHVNLVCRLLLEKKI